MRFVRVMPWFILAALLSCAATAHAAIAAELIPATAPRGATAIIVGSGLDAAGVEVTFAASGNRTPAAVTSRGPSILELRVPFNATSGEVRVTLGGSAVATFSFAVTPTPEIVKVSTLVAASAVHGILKQPSGLFVGLPSGVAYVADRAHHQIKSILPTGVVTLLAGTGQPGHVDGPGAAARFHEPSGIVFDPVRKVLYVADHANHLIRRLTLDGAVSTFAGLGRPEDRDGAGTLAAFNQPSGLALDAAGSLYVADSGNHKIRKISPDGMVTTFAGVGRPGFSNGVAGEALFKSPQGIAIDTTGALLVADTANHVVRRVVDGVVSTLAGSGQPGALDGSGLLAQFKEPAAIAIDDTGDTIVADAGNHRIRRIASGVVTTLAGSGAPAYVDGSNGVAAFHGPAGLAWAGAIFVADTKNDALRVLYTTPGLTDVYPRAGDPRGGETVQIFGTGFVAGQTMVTIGGAPATVVFVSSTALLATTPPGALGGAAIVVTTPAGSAALPASFRYIPPFIALSITPSSVQLHPGETAALIATGIQVDGTLVDLTSAVRWETSDPAIASISTTGIATALVAGTASISASYDLLSANAQVRVVPREDLPFDPATTAPPLDGDRVASFTDRTSFLYSGPNPLQRDVAPGAIVAERASILRGQVFDREGRPLGGVRVAVHDSTATGYTLSRIDGRFDLAVNGGGRVTLTYSKASFLPVHRDIALEWNTFRSVPDAALTPLDSQVTRITLGSTETQIAQSTTSSDVDGPRQATILVPPATSASLVLPDGSTQSVAELHVRGTEYTVGPNGPRAMPAPLPPQTAYTYCVELSADEAITAGADTIRFSQPVPLYVDNFLGFPVGEAVPAGYYDRRRAMWVAIPNGRVIRIVSVAGGDADLDINGDGAPDADSALVAHGITAGERAALATLFPAGRTLWRVQLTHFTPYDLNWPGAPSLPTSATSPGQPTPGGGPGVDRAALQCGSVIGCESQTLGERVPVAGTPFTLTYDSAKFPGRLAGRTAEVRLTGDTLPAMVEGIDLLIEVAGQEMRRSYGPATNLTETFTWDGRDVYGRAIRGDEPARITISYRYRAEYRRSVGTFLQFGGETALRASRTGLALAETHDVTFRTWDARALGLGGWSVDVLNMLDPQSGTQHLGNGQARTDREGTIRTVAGRNQSFSTCNFSDGALATSVPFSTPFQAAFTADGTMYWVACGRVFRRAPDGRVYRFVASTVGGNTNSGDGGPALNATLQGPRGVAVGPDGSVYVSDFSGARIRRVAPDGIITRFAGTGIQGTSGDGGLAVDARLERPGDLTVGPDGTVYVAQANFIIRRITPDGVISTLTQFGQDPGTTVPIGQARFFAKSVAAAPDGNVYILSLSDVWRLGTDGYVRRVGRATSCPPAPAYCNPETQHITVALDGMIYVSGTVGEGNEQLFFTHRMSPDGTIEAVARGRDARVTQPFTLNDLQFGGDGGSAIGARYNLPDGIAIAPDGALHISDTWNHRIRRVSQGLVSTRPTGERYVASEDGAAIFFYDAEGRHLRTVDARTNVALLTFAYGAAGQIETITDAVGNVTRIERTGASIVIVAPGGQRTTLTLDGAGMLRSVANPASETVRFEYDAQGLLRYFRDAKSQLYTFLYDALGRLLRDDDPAGGRKSLSLVRSGIREKVTVTSLLGRTTTYGSEPSAGGGLRRTRISPDGSVATTTESAGERTTTLPNGTVFTSTLTADPRFGSASYVSKLAIRTPENRRLTIEASRTATLAAFNDPFSLTRETSTTTVVTTFPVSSRTWTTELDVAARRISTRTPRNRTSATTLDALGRLLRIEVPTRAPIDYGYDPTGRLSTIVQGERMTTFGYDTRNRLTSVNDGVRTVTFGHDEADRVITETLPGNRQIAFRYDANGNVTGVTPPGRGEHAFAATPVDLNERYTTPLGAVTRYVYNADRQLTSIVRPEDEITLAYDSFGRLSGMAGKGVATTYGYLPGGILESSAQDGITTSYAYDGILLTSVEMTGEITSTIQLSYDAAMRLSRETAAGQSISFGYDDDDLLVAAGELTMTRDAATGALAASVLSAVSDAWTYNAHGEASRYAATASAAPVFAQDLVRDTSGRITRITDSLNGVAVVYDYGYDAAGRLETVQRDGTPVASYGYDSNGNRTQMVTSAGTVTATYDGDDRMATYGDATYAYSAAGDLLSRTTPAGTTTYDYDAAGNLRTVVLPGGTTIEYVIDGQQRRVGKKLNGTLVAAWVYRDQLQIVAELDGTGQVRSRFVYGSRSNVPDYMIRNGVRYRILSNHLGSPRVILNASNGAVAQMLGYDEFGNVLADTNPGFQPFGFAGGLYDRDTGLVRFGARDYDPNTGRWTSKEPLGFGGGDTNFYSYAQQDPVNLIDPSGLLFGGTVNAGEAYGQAALTQYADILTDPNAAWYEIAGAAAGGFFSSLWTPCTSDATFTTLTVAYSANAYVGRSFWQYYPSGNAAYNSRYLTRGPGWWPPYSFGDDAVKKLSLPPWNPGTAARPVPSRWNQWVGGPRPGGAAPNYGHSGGGTEYLIGAWPK